MARSADILDGRRIPMKTRYAEIPACAHEDTELLDTTSPAPLR
jgi:hypothetical protein